MKIGALSAFLLSVLGSVIVEATDCDGDKVIHQTDVLIIGAGVSAMRAKTRIAEVDPTLHVTLVEANDRVGGRVETVPFANVLIPNGPQWLDAGNAVYDLIVENGVRIVEDNFFDISGYEYTGCDEDRRLNDKGVANIHKLIQHFGKDESSEAEKVLSRRFLHRLDKSASGEEVSNQITYFSKNMLCSRQYVLLHRYPCNTHRAISSSALLKGFQMKNWPPCSSCSGMALSTAAEKHLSNCARRT